jgi:AraC-like DNA-binding protein
MGLIELSVRRTRSLEAASTVAPQDSFVHPDRIMKAHDILFVTKGGWEVMEEESTYVLKAGDILFLYAGRHHFGRRRFLSGTSWSYIHCSADSDDRFHPDGVSAGNTDTSITFPSLIHVPAGDHRMAGLFSEIIFCHWSSAALNRLKAGVLTTQLLIELSHRASSIERDVTISPIRHCIDLIERNPGVTFSLDYFMRKTGLERRALTRRFRAITGTSIRQYQLQFKMRVARALLDTNSIMSIRAVAAELGFTDEFHFSRYFKKLVGTSPSEYRHESAPLPVSGPGPRKTTARRASPPFHV